jgi:hypothetical protein
MTRATSSLHRSLVRTAATPDARRDARALLDGIATILRNDPAAIAAALGVCRSDLWRWEAGEPPSPQEYARIERLAAQASRLVSDGAVRTPAFRLRQGVRPGS